MARDPRDNETGPPKISGLSELERAAVIETSIQQAIRRGEFDDLPGAGKPLKNIDGKHDPDWWIKQKIENEDLTGLGPPALSLRVENAEIEQRLSAMTREEDVREYLADFNKRIIEARRQLLGGPPVVTPTRDVEAEMHAWRERRNTAKPQVTKAQEEHQEPRKRRWFGRWI